MCVVGGGCSCAGQSGSSAEMANSSIPNENGVKGRVVYIAKTGIVCHWNSRGPKFGIVRFVSVHEFYHRDLGGVERQLVRS